VARERPTASNVVPPTRRITEREDVAWSALTRAEAHALRRSAPLTPAQFKRLRRLAEKGEDPLRHL
jgi:hypothetical protein